MALAAILFGLLAAVSWGVADFLAAKAGKRFGGLATGVMVTVISAVIFGVVYLIFYRGHSVFDSAGLAYAVASGVAFTAANLAFYKGLEHGPVSVVSPLGSLYPVITTLLLVLFFAGQLSSRQGIGIAIVMGGMLAASGLFERIANGRRLSKGPMLGVMGAVFWGLAWALIAQSVNRIGWQFTAVVELWVSAILFLPLLPLLKRSEPKIMQRLLPSLKDAYMLSAGVLMMCGFLALSIGLEVVGELASTAVVISACYAVITVFLAFHKLGEKFDPIPVVGAFVAVGGIAILSLG